MEALCYVLGKDTKVPWIIEDKNTKYEKRHQDFWEFSKKFILNAVLLKSVVNFKEE